MASSTSEALGNQTRYCSINRPVRRRWCTADMGHNPGIMLCAIEAGSASRPAHLRGDADRAGVRVAFAHHDAAQRDQRRRREAELLGAQKSRHRNVPPRAHLPVRLQPRGIDNQEVTRGTAGPYTEVAATAPCAAQMSAQLELNSPSQQIDSSQKRLPGTLAKYMA